MANLGCGSARVLGGGPISQQQQHDPEPSFPEDDDPRRPGCNRARLVLLAAAACLGVGAVYGRACADVPPRPTTTGLRFSVRRGRAAAPAPLGGESEEGGHQGFLLGDPPAAGLRPPSLVSGDNHANETPPFATFLDLAGGGEAVATGVAVAADDDAVGDQSGAGRVVEGKGSHHMSQPLVADDHYQRNQAMRPSGSIVAAGSSPRRSGPGGLGRAGLVLSGEGDVVSDGGRRGSGGRGGGFGSEDDRGDGGIVDEESLSRHLLLPPGEGHGSGNGVCRPLEIEGLDNCPELMLNGGVPSNAVVESLLATKADMLRQVIEVLTDPASAGEGGDPDEPLLLVQKLALDETDVIFGAFESRFLKHVPDAAAWSPVPGGFNRWLSKYHRKILRGTRPVLVTVHGDDVCALEKELSLEARTSAAAAGFEPEHDDAAGITVGSYPSGMGALAQARRQATPGGDHAGMRSTEGHGRASPGREGRRLVKEEDFEVPVVLMTLGWDPFGDPTHQETSLGRDRSCVFRVLEMERVVKWFTSHTRYDSHTDEKFRYLPIGFGGYQTRNGLRHTAYIDAARRQLEILETCPLENAGRYDLLFQCNSLERDPRTAIWKEMTEGKGPGTPIPVNRAPLRAADMVKATARGIFGVSPPGTGPDCFRHYEMMLEGTIALVPDVYSLRQFMKGLPAFFFGGREEAWTSLNCGRLLEMAETVRAMIEGGARQGGAGGGGGGLQLEKLTHGFWRRYIRREVLLAGGTTDEGAAYVRRSAIPLNPRGWTTFRRVGCFSRGEGSVSDEPRKGGQSRRPARSKKKPFRRSRHSGEAPPRRRAAAAAAAGEDEEPPRDVHGQRQLFVAGAQSVRLERPGRTPESCAAHCSTKIGGGIGFFGISSGDRCWCDKGPGTFLPAERCDIDCDDGKGSGSCGGKEASTVYVFGPEDGGAPFEYLGCFPSTPYVMFHAALRLGNGSTPSVCAAFCTSLRFPFFALERSELCRCGVMPANSPRSDKAPAHIEGAGYEPVLGPPNGTRAAKPVPEGVRVGDPRFECHLGRCKGDSSLMGCGSARAYDLYRNTDPCVLYRDC